MKKNFVFFTTLSILLFTFSSTLAQSDSLLALINDLSENETYLADQLLDLQENPVNLNDADKNEFLRLPLLTSQLADSIIANRLQYGRYRSKRQIRPIIGAALYNLIKNYLTVSQKKTYKLHLTHRNVYKIERIHEIETGKFKGDALNDYTRLKYTVNPNTIVGLVTQKDVGEKNYLDHLNFNVHYRNKNWSVLLGNFYLQMAEGLSHSNSYGSQKSIYLAAVFREATQIARANLTSSESSGKFGLFVQNNLFQHLTLFSFYSNASRDAQITKNSVSGFKYDGLHRSANELAAKDKFREMNWGGGIKYQFFNSILLTLFFNHYSFSKNVEQSKALIGENQKRRQYFNFSGSRLSQLTTAYSWQLNHFRISAELSSSSKGKPGFLQSVYYSKKKFHLGFKYWFLAKTFQSVDGRVFDNSDPFPRGVKGFFAAGTIRFNKYNTLSALKNYQQRTWRSYFNPLPTNKSEWLLQWDLKIKPVQFVSRFRFRKSEDFTIIEHINQRIENEQKTIRLQLSYNPVKNLNSRTRWEHTYLPNSTEKGTLFFQEINYILNRQLSLNTRFTFFRTSSFNSRIYEYERDLPGNFSNVALFGNGNKLYVLLKWKIVANFSLWFKWRYISKDEILANGALNKALSRDIRLQIQTAF